MQNMQAHKLLAAPPGSLSWNPNDPIQREFHVARPPPVFISQNGCTNPYDRNYFPLAPGGFPPHSNTATPAMPLHYHRQFSSVPNPPQPSSPQSFTLPLSTEWQPQHHGIWYPNLTPQSYYNPLQIPYTTCHPEPGIEAISPTNFPYSKHHNQANCTIPYFPYSTPHHVTPPGPYIYAGTTPPLLPTTYQAQQQQQYHHYHNGPSPHLNSKDLTPPSKRGRKTRHGIYSPLHPQSARGFTLPIPRAVYFPAGPLSVPTPRAAYAPAAPLPAPVPQRLVKVGKISPLGQPTESNKGEPKPGSKATPPHAGEPQQPPTTIPSSPPPHPPPVAAQTSGVPCAPAAPSAAAPAPGMHPLAVYVPSTGLLPFDEIPPDVGREEWLRLYPLSPYGGRVIPMPKAAATKKEEEKEEGLGKHDRDEREERGSGSGSENEQLLTSPLASTCCHGKQAAAETDSATGSRPGAASGGAAGKGRAGGVASVVGRRGETVTAKTITLPLRGITTTELGRPTDEEYEWCVRRVIDRWRVREGLWPEGHWDAKRKVDVKGCWVP